MKYPYLN